MIARFQNSILPQIVRFSNLRKLLTNVGSNSDFHYSVDNRFKSDKNNEINTPETLKTAPPQCSADHNFIVDENGYVNVFTDGACSFNGQGNSRAGIGVWFGDDHPLNISEAVKGRSTNNVAEILAVTKAAEQAKKAGVKKLKIYTDSMFIIMCITRWMKRWKVTGWLTIKKTPVINKTELLELESALSSMEVTWVHISSHAGHYGNEKAHHLAAAGVHNIEKENKEAE